MNVSEYKFSNYIFVITGMSYLVDSSGTSKVVKAHEEIFKSNGIGYVAVFPISRSRGEGADWHCKTTGCYGFAIDGRFIGVKTANEVLNVLIRLNEIGKNCIGILIHHVIRNDLSEIRHMIEKIKYVPIIYYLHDFYTCCVNPNLMKNDFQSCIEGNVSCDGCNYQKKRKDHLGKIKRFLQVFIERITFVAPSEYTRNHWIYFYPEYANKVIVIPHQKAIGEYGGNKEAVSDKEALRLGFVGAQKHIKGWDVFRKIVEKSRHAGCKYEFYYFGNGKNELDGVKAVHVDIATQGKDAMINALREYNISAVFLVCVCGETYSYTAYESNAANCFIFAMASGGNIPYMVRKNKWGHVYSSEEELEHALLDEKELREEINEWKLTAKPGATGYLDNAEIIKLFSVRLRGKINWKIKRTSPSQAIKRSILNKIFIITRMKENK